MAGFDVYTIARFWAKVRVGKPTQCWPWQGGKGHMGYGRFKIGGRLVLSHHVAWEIANGPLPEFPGYHGTVVRHSCDNPSCCNWRHLRPGTQQENVADMDIKGRRGAPAGGKLTVEEVAAIIADPRTHREIGRDFGINYRHVGAIKRGDRYKLSKRVAELRRQAMRPAETVPQQQMLF